MNTKLSSFNPLSLDIQTIIDSGKVIGKGSERTCYVLKDFPGVVFKISPAGHTKQAERELAYYRFLKSRNVPLDHIPLIYGSAKDETGGIIILQQLILDQRNKISKSLYGFVDEASSDVALETKRAYAHEILNRLEDYLLEHNIVTCDVVPSNVLLCRKNHRLNFYLIDGMGTEDFIPLCKYWSWLGQPKITRHINKARRKLDMFADQLKEKLRDPEFRLQRKIRNEIG